MPGNTRGILFVLSLLPFVCGSVGSGCPLTARDFVKISENGFDLADSAVDGNHYPWSMTHFEGNGAQKGDSRYVYVGTGNNIAVLTLANLDVPLGVQFDNTFVAPPEIWRSGVNEDPPRWEKVFDYRDVEPGPLFDTVGFRHMTTYTPPAKNGVPYIYASTYGVSPAIWRSPSGDYGTWEKVWETDIGGSIRSMQELDGILYFAPTQELVEIDLAHTELWATDGEEFWPVNQDGFGNPNNLAITCLNAFNGWLYAGTANFEEGGEIWKIRDTGDKAYTFQRVVANGGPDARNEIFGSTGVFGDHVYFGTMIFGGFNFISGNVFKGADLIRIDANDNWETIVGDGGCSEWDSGFDYPFNAYIWQLTEHDGWFYASTWDMSGAIFEILRELTAGTPSHLTQLLLDILGQFFSGDLAISLLDTVEYPKREPAPLDRLFHAGADLYKSPDGVHWSPVFLEGLGNPLNYGIRTLRSVGDYLYVGFANPYEGLEVWRGRAGGTGN